LALASGIGATAAGAWLAPRLNTAQRQTVHVAVRFTIAATIVGTLTFLLASAIAPSQPIDTIGPGGSVTPQAIIDTILVLARLLLLALPESLIWSLLLGLILERSAVRS
jgi:hypothetical protein